MYLPRKIQLTGRNTYIVSLPHEWVIAQGVNKGDAIYLVDNEDGTLSLSLRQTERAEKRCVISVSEGQGSSEITMRNIVSAYVGGASKIMLKGKGTHTLAEETRRILSGVEITDENGDEITLGIMALDEISTDNIIKREFNVTQTMFEVAANYFRSSGKTSISQRTQQMLEISRKEDEVDRLYLLLLRMICLGRYAVKEAIFKAMVAKSIEKISDHLEDMCMSGKDIELNDGIGHLIEKSGSLHACAYDSFVKNELDRGNFINAKNNYLNEVAKVESLVRKEKNNTKIVELRSLMDKCNKVLRYSEDIMESASDRVFAELEDVEGN